MLIVFLLGFFQHVCRSATLASGAEMLGRTGLDFLFSRNCLLYKFLWIVHVHIQISSFGRCVRILSLTHEPSKIDLNFSKF